jgi:hypothetical protein
MVTGAATVGVDPGFSGSTGPCARGAEVLGFRRKSLVDWAAAPEPQTSASPAANGSKTFASEYLV